MSAAAGKKMDDSGPQNWVVPEVMKPEEKELVEKLTQVMSKNTFHRAKEATRLARSYGARPAHAVRITSLDGLNRPYG